MVKRVREGMYGCRSKEEFYTSKGKTFMVERIEPRGKYGITFGKHKGKTFRQVFKEDSQYILWFVQN